jgi:hypothetical protein
LKILFCFDISNPSYSTKAFKLAVPKAEEACLLDELVWPADIMIKPWVTHVRNDTASRHIASNDLEMIIQSETIERASIALDIVVRTSDHLRTILSYKMCPFFLRQSNFP